MGRTVSRTLKPRTLLFFLPAFFCATLPSDAALSLTDLDLSKLQTREGPFSGAEQYRSDAGFVLSAGQSLWVDLKGDAEELRATLEPLPGVPGQAVRCCFSTANAVREILVRSDSRAQNVVLPLKGEDLLTVEAFADGPASSIRVHVTSSSISSKSVRPEAVGGGARTEWNTGAWHVRIDGRSGGISELSSPSDKYKMEWVRQAAPWGTGWARIGERDEAWTHPIDTRGTGPQSMQSTYRLSRMRIRVDRALDKAGRLTETYVFENTSETPLTFGEGGIGIRVPLVDSYPGAEVCLTNRCHAHLWMGGTSSYICALRMGGDAPHLGLVLSEGSLTSYSIHDRITHSNDRGQFVVHPSPFTLAPGESRKISWVVFWHTGWEDFFAKAAELPGFVRLQADRYTISEGDAIRLRVQMKVSPSSVKLSLNGETLPIPNTELDGSFQIVPSRLGEQLIEVDTGRGPALLRALVTPKPRDLIERRVRFILDHQQKHAPGDPLDGAFLGYDNETNELVYDKSVSDHNAGRERLAMGTLVALYAPLCQDAQLRTRIDESLAQYAKFVARELQNPSGKVFNDVGRRGPIRLYNNPWVIQFHLAMYKLYLNPEYLRLAVDTCRSYYASGGERFYCIGMPVTEMLDALERAGWTNERKEMLAAFRKHAETLRAIGGAYPKSEVNYEQSIVAPAAVLMLEVYAATHEEIFLRGAEDQLERLELFGGLQPDYHLHDIAIRHWDDFWFGKRRLYGDTFPHYWSTITATAFDLYGELAQKPDFRARAEGILFSNFAAFSADGRASCAYVYPLRVNGSAGRFFDPWANDQDWALVAYLQSLK
ncbi:MAG TPA: hypothetical protein VFT72_20695 [Opitutaceae bacterium]|nr:hypothetical protein [Opitutaceae bacterium]